MSKKPLNQTASENGTEAAPAKKQRRGKEAVKAALITAAGELLAEIGPKAMSVRDVAVRAGVNHGQVHHYFNGKDGLIKTAMRALAKEHMEHARLIRTLNIIGQ